MNKFWDKTKSPKQEMILRKLRAKVRGVIPWHTKYSLPPPCLHKLSYKKR
jgi:hypothetical protein